MFELLAHPSEVNVLVVDTVGWIVGISVSQSVSSSSSSVVVDFVGRTVIDPDPVGLIVELNDLYDQSHHHHLQKYDLVGRTVIDPDPVGMIVADPVGMIVVFQFHNQSHYLCSAFETTDETLALL